MKLKVWLLEKAKLTNLYWDWEKKNTTQINKAINERGDIKTDITKIQRSYETPMNNTIKLDKLGEMNKLLERYNTPHLNHKEVAYLELEM
jgi:hypothetical protein